VSRSIVIPLFSAGRPRFAGDDAALVTAIRDGQAGCTAELFDRYGAHVQRVLANILGFDHELADLIQEVFARALASLNSLNDGAKLKAWLTTIAVFTARGCIRARTRRRWLGLATPAQIGQQPAPRVPEEVREALRSTYEVLEQLPSNERIAFTLRYVHGLDLTDLAEACGVSLATIKRRLAKARHRFMTLARHRPALRVWVEEESRG
jgi:RNA polymerase sigma-70 factor (ECF subfamily)